MTHEHDDHHNSGSVNEEHLTAYALGELSGDERAAVEQAIANDPASAREVDRIREAAAQIDHAMQSGPAVGLTEEHHARIEEALRELETNRSTVVIVETKRVLRIRRVAWYAGGGLALAACLAIAILIPMIANDPSSSMDVAIGPVEESEDGVSSRMAHEDAGLDDMREESAEVPLGEGAEDSDLYTIRGGGSEADDLSRRFQDGADSAEEQKDASAASARANQGFAKGSDTGQMRDREVAQSSPQAPTAGGRGGGFGGGGGGSGGGGGFGGGSGGGSGSWGGAPSESKVDELRSETDAIALQLRKSQTREAPRERLRSREGERADRKESLRDSILTIAPITTSVLAVQEALDANRSPDSSNVHVDDLINYFVPEDELQRGASEPALIVQSESAESPWTPNHWLVRVSVQNNGEEPVRGLEQVISFDPERIASYELIGFTNEAAETPDAERPLVDGVLEPGETFIALYDVERRRTVHAPGGGGGGALQPAADERRGRARVAGVSPLLQVVIRESAKESDDEDDRDAVTNLVIHIADDSARSLSESSRAFRMSALAAAVGLHLQGDPRVPADALRDMRALLLEPTFGNKPADKERELLALTEQVIALSAVDLSDSPSSGQDDENHPDEKKLADPDAAKEDGG